MDFKALNSLAINGIPHALFPFAATFAVGSNTPTFSAAEGSSFQATETSNTFEGDE